MLTEQEKQFLVAVLRELRFAPEAAENAVFARNLIAKLSQPDNGEERLQQVQEDLKTEEQG